MGALLLVNDVRMPDSAVFLPLSLAVVCCFDLLSVVLLLGQFIDTGRMRLLVLSCAYLFAGLTLIGRIGTWSGVPGMPGPLATVPSTASWLWLIWQASFSVLLAVAMAPWLDRGHPVMPATRRRALAWWAVGGSAAAGALVVVAVVALSAHLPVLISGDNTSELARLAGPVIVPLVAIATAVTIEGARRRTGPERWTGLAAVASLADVVLTLASQTRFSVGWYAGRTLTVVAAGAVLMALLAQFNGIRRRLASEGEQLRVTLEQTDRLERLQQTLLGHMRDGVVMYDRNGEVVASNRAARALLALPHSDAGGCSLRDTRWRWLRADGTPTARGEPPILAAVGADTDRRDEVIGVVPDDGRLRWLAVSATPVLERSGSADFTVCTLSDVTAQHGAALAAAQEAQARHDSVRQVLDRGGPSMVFQPIVELATGRPVGFEALARFPGDGSRRPDQWFSDAADVGLGLDLELSAIASALRLLDRLPEGAYLSVNASPATVTSGRLSALLAAVPPGRVVLELTEHVGVQDYTALGHALAHLRHAGVRVAIDDAGSGFASLQHILNLEPDVIKLDAALVSGVDGDPARRALAGSLLTFATEIGAQVVAEGVETQREQDALCTLGIRLGQGYHLGHPAPMVLHGVGVDGVPASGVIASARSL
jgi:EAL domain-containing protein (putative c-di-GMP-specific phosphodiesterase class I)/PAS domain-containing protein